MTTNILIFGTGKITRRNFNRHMDTFVEQEKLGDDLRVVMYADDDWDDSHDNAFDWALESSADVVVLAATEPADEVLVESLSEEDATVELHDDIYSAALTEHAIDMAVVFFDEDDEDMTDDVMALLDMQVRVFDVCSGMVEFDVSEEVEESGEGEGEETSEDSADESEQDVSLPEPTRVQRQGVAKLVELVSEGADEDAILDRMTRSTVLAVAKYAGIEVKKGQHTTTVLSAVMEWYSEFADELVAAYGSDEAPDVDESDDSADDEGELDSTESSEDEASEDSDDSADEELDVTGEAVAAEAPLYEFAPPGRMVAPTNVVLDIAALLEVYDGDVESALTAAKAFGFTFG